ncbi:PKD domain-containing protein [Cellulomonas triticagri]|nr:PKD domain-containing protein [Cellulomonas triticagri]
MRGIRSASTAAAVISFVVATSGVAAGAAASPGSAAPGAGSEFGVVHVGSRDRAGLAGDVAWDFGDGTTATHPVVTHNSPPGGSYDVTLVVTDDEDALELGSEEELFTVVLGPMQPGLGGGPATPVPLG